MEKDPEMEVTPLDNYLRLDRGRAGDGSGDEGDPPISSGWTEVEPDMEMAPPSPKVRHIWDWDQKWSVASKGRT